jgi:hypothetical protein
VLPLACSAFVLISLRRPSAFTRSTTLYVLDHVLFHDCFARAFSRSSLHSLNNFCSCRAVVVFFFHFLPAVLLPLLFFTSRMRRRLRPSLLHLCWSYDSVQVAAKASK